jgi:hypothetical protein
VTNVAVDDVAAVPLVHASNCIKFTRCLQVRSCAATAASMAWHMAK